MKRTPVLFVGHGSPMNAIEDNNWTHGFSALGAEIGRPSAILSISAHWYTKGSFVTANRNPETIHDFGGFPDELYKIRYPAPGSSELADKVAMLMGGSPTIHRTDWGLDHGSWSVLRWMYPKADVPVIQLSINSTLEEAEHLAIAKALQPLRDEGVLIMGSGNIVHNLKDAFAQMRANTNITPDWATRFDDRVAQLLEQFDTTALLKAPGTEDGLRAHPTPDHWLPLLYAYGAVEPGEQVNFPIEGFDLGTISMRAVVFGS